MELRYLVSYVGGRAREERFIITSSRMTEAVDYRAWGFHEVIHARNQGVVRRAQDGVADSGNGQVDHQRFSTFRVDLTVKPIVDRPTGPSCRLTL